MTTLPTQPNINQSATTQNIQLSILANIIDYSIATSPSQFVFFICCFPPRLRYLSESALPFWITNVFLWHPVLTLYLPSTSTLSSLSVCLSPSPLSLLPLVLCLLVLPPHLQAHTVPTNTQTPLLMSCLQPLRSLSVCPSPQLSAQRSSSGCGCSDNLCMLNKVTEWKEIISCCKLLLHGTGIGVDQTGLPTTL